MPGGWPRVAGWALLAGRGWDGCMHLLAAQALVLGGLCSSTPLGLDLRALVVGTRRRSHPRRLSCPPRSVRGQW